MKLNKEKFMKTEMGGELEETIRTWDKAIDERRKATPGIGNPDQGLGFKYWDNTCRSCQDRWEVFKLAIKQFYGIEFFFTRTDEYFGVCSEDEQVWLIKEEKDTTKIGSKEYLVLADCLVDSCMMTWGTRTTMRCWMPESSDCRRLEKECSQYQSSEERSFSSTN